MRKTTVKIPIYYGSLNIIVTDGDVKEVENKYKLPDMSTFGAFVWNDLNKDNIWQYYVCVEEGVSGHLIAHEVVHLVNAMYLDRGIELDRYNDEPQAYLTGWLFKEIENFVYGK